MSDGSPERAAQRNGPFPSQKSGRMKAGTKPGKSKASATPALLGLRADVVAVVEDDRARALEREHGPHVVGDRGRRPLQVLLRIASSQLERPPRVAARSGRSRPADRARSSGRSPRPAPATADELRLDFRGVGDEADRQRPSRPARQPSTQAIASSRSVVTSSTVPACWRRCARCGSTSIAEHGAPFMVTASGCAPPMPPSPAVS